MTAEDRQLIKKIILLTIPAAIDFGLQSAANYADYIMVGRLGQNASAAIGLTTEVSFLFRGVLTALGIGFVSYISVAIGKKECRESKRTAAQAFYVASAAGMLLLIIGVSISDYLPVWLGADESIQKLASGYFRINYFGMLGSAFNMIFGSVLKGNGNMKTPLYVNIVMNVINIFLNFWLIFESREITLAGNSIFVWGAGLGVDGAAWGTAIANTIGGIFMVAAVCRQGNLLPEKAEYRFESEINRKIFRIAFPAFLCRIITSMGRIIFVAFVTRLGTTAFAAHTITFTAESMFYMPVVGAQSAVTILAGNIHGEGNRNKLNRLVRFSCILIGVIMLGVGGLMIFTAPTVLSFFTHDQEVIQIGKVLFCIVAVNEPIFGISVVMEGIFNGMGNTKHTFRVSAVSLWIVRVFGTYLTTYIFHMGVYGAWICMVLENTVRGIVLLISYYKGRMKNTCQVFLEKA